MFAFAQKCLPVQTTDYVMDAPGELSGLSDCGLPLFSATSAQLLDDLVSKLGDGLPEMQATAKEPQADRKPSNESSGEVEVFAEPGRATQEVKCFTYRRLHYCQKMLICTPSSRKPRRVSPSSPHVVEGRDRNCLRASEQRTGLPHLSESTNYFDIHIGYSIVDYSVYIQRTQAATTQTKLFWYRDAQTRFRMRRKVGQQLQAVFRLVH